MVQLKNRLDALATTLKSQKINVKIAPLKPQPELESKYAFSPEEYEYFMGLIKQINPTAYVKLKKCEDVTSNPCIEKYLDKDPEFPDSLGKVFEGDAESQGYPLLLLDPALKDHDEEFQKAMLQLYLKIYNEEEIVPPITPQEQENIMKIIKSIDPRLYQEIVAVDPTGSEHIARDYRPDTISVSASQKDGLPIINIYSSAIVEFPFDELRWVIGHELGHYVLGHVHEDIEKYKVRHKGLVPTEKGSGEFKKVKKVSGQLPFEITFQKALQRTYEDEADRFAVVDLGIGIDAGIAAAKRYQLKLKEHEIASPEKEMFYRTHPFWPARIKHLNELRREVELRKARKMKPKEINWKALAEDYLKSV